MKLTLATLLLAATAPAALAAEFGENEIFFELNDTDGDLGIHALIDGEPYSTLEIRDAGGSTMLALSATGAMTEQGVTEFVFESGEPSFDELAPADFFARFPEGVYSVVAAALEGEELVGEATVSHVMPAPAVVTVNGQPAAESCDSPNLPAVAAPVVIAWAPVTESHPEVGTAGPVEIVRYQAFVELGETKVGIDLPPTATSFGAPPEILALGTEFKFEVIARTASGNNTAIESCFTLTQ